MAFHKAKALQEAEKSVAQGKIAQAIKQYQVILDNDPADVSLLNTVGDLYIRDRNITEGLRQFHRLAEAYVREGFNVKAIAIYRKISKVDPNSIDTLVKLADLYQLQGLSREAREQYLQVADFFKKRNQPDRVLEVLRKLVQLDPESLNFRNRLAVECEQAGKAEEAAAAYLESAEICLRRDDQAGAGPFLKKAAELDPKNAKILILRARVAVACSQPEEAEKIISSTPELHADIAVKRILLDAYIGSRKLAEAGNLVLEVFHANPSDFTPVSTVTKLLAEHGDVDEAFRLVASVADSQLSQNHAGPALDALRRIWAKAPKHIPTLELMHLVCEKSADELTLPEVLEALGQAYEEAGNMEKAEAAYQKLAEREPENEHFRGLLNDVQQKLGRELRPSDFSSAPVAMAEDDEETPPEPEVIDADQELMVKEALENSDLFARYNLTEKAIVELEKVLQFYPDQIEVHRRILEISRKGFPQRGAVAAAQLARIFHSRGEVELANKYQAIASGTVAMQDLPHTAPPPGKKLEEPVPTPAASPSPELAVPMEFPLSAVPAEYPVAAPGVPPPPEFSFDVAPTEAVAESAPIEPPPAPAPPPQALVEQTLELDLSGDLEAMAAFGFEPAPAPEPEAVAPLPEEAQPPKEATLPPEEFALPPLEEEALPPVETPAEVAAEPLLAIEPESIPVDLEDSRIEVEFYLENGFIDEARQTVALLEEKYPGSPFVANLRLKLEEHVSTVPPMEQMETFAPSDHFGGAEPAPELGLAEQHPEVEGPVPEVPLAEPTVAPEVPSSEAEWTFPADFEDTILLDPAVDTLDLPPAAEPEPAVASAITPSPVESVAPPPEPLMEASASAAGGVDVFGDLAGDLASSLDGLAAPPAPVPPIEMPPAPMAAAPADVPPVESLPTPKEAAPVAGTPQGASQLSGLLADMEDSGAANRDDPETHYNLGVAFREMGLLDESIGEFQKVVRGAGKGKYPPNFLQACSLLAICFMEKKMPALAVKWYKRALETPDLDEEALMALEYDLGVAYELAGDSRNALERYTEVYSQNIDFRDVAEKIRELQQKA